MEVETPLFPGSDIRHQGRVRDLAVSAPHLAVSLAGHTETALLKAAERAEDGGLGVSFRGQPAEIGQDIGSNPPGGQQTARPLLKRRQNGLRGLTGQQNIKIGAETLGFKIEIGADPDGPYPQFTQLLRKTGGHKGVAPILGGHQGVGPHNYHRGRLQRHQILQHLPVERAVTVHRRHVTLEVIEEKTQVPVDGGGGGIGIVNQMLDPVILQNPREVT